MASSTIGQLTAPSQTINTSPSTSRGGCLVGSRLVTGGLYHVSGVTESAGVPVSRVVYLLSAISPNLIIDKQTTLSDGLFDFKYLLPGDYSILGVNEAGTQNNVTYANITAVVM